MSISLASISNPEFINLKPCDINPLMSSCEIKVLYVGQNRNRTFISKDVATEMSKTLRGAPIVGWYRKEKEDFRDHGDRITIDEDGIKFDCMTRPYGFVSPDARVWFQKFSETDAAGRTVEREYLMTTGFLWTGQFEECQDVVESGRPHSMELDENSLKGNWSTIDNSNIEFFIVNDAVFSKLCILGEDVEPCFEGSEITVPEVSKNFTLDDNFKQTLYSMMQDLKFALKGEAPMNDEKENVQVNETPETGSEKFSATQDNVDKTIMDENQNSTEAVVDVETSFVAKKDDEKKEDAQEEKTDTNEEDTPSSDDKEDDEDKKKKYALLEEKYNDLDQKYTALQNDYQALIDFKNKIESEKKDNMIKEFYMLSDEDKKDVIDNKDKYSLDQIEAKLSIIYTKKQMASEQQQKVESNNVIEPSVTYNLDNEVVNLPDWVKAVRETEKEMNI